jgi:hypothetical protein
MKRVFLYVRVSTEEQAIHGLSIEAQTTALQAGLYVRLLLPMKMNFLCPVFAICKGAYVYWAFCKRNSRLHKLKTLCRVCL